MEWSAIDKVKLKSLHPDLIRVLEAWRANTHLRCRILETERSAEQQRINVAKAVSQTTRSRHVRANNRNGFVCAVDIGVMKSATQLSWQWPDYSYLAREVKAAAHRVGVPIEWGGDWRTLKDGPHFQLPRKDYP